jgi:CRISPR/Cas system Type II protein with McrA/HNH and RuvC-like nuclease domain
MRWAIYKREGGRCFYCLGEIAELQFEIDHIYPRSKGGTDCPTNLVAACRACNNEKSDFVLPVELTAAITPEIEAAFENIKIARARRTQKAEAA